MFTCSFILCYCVWSVVCCSCAPCSFLFIVPALMFRVSSVCLPLGAHLFRTSKPWRPEPRRSLNSLSLSLYLSLLSLHMCVYIHNLSFVISIIITTTIIIISMNICMYICIYIYIYIANDPLKKWRPLGFPRFLKSKSALWKVEPCSSPCTII